MAFSTDHELLPVVDRQDRQTGTAERARIHREGLLHRAVHVLLFNGAGQVYLQKRSREKDTYPGFWTSSASGHVDPGESYLRAAERELMEELGLSLTLRPVGKLAAGPATENEFTFVFAAQGDAPPAPNPREIERGGFFTWPAALALASDPSRGCPSLLAVMGIFTGHPDGCRDLIL